MRDANIEVSVIVLTYNHEKYIAQALDSILMQKTDFAFEILIGDDASTDATPQILRKYQENYPDVIRLFQRERNVGATANAYPLFFEAKGDYLAACEGDDFWIAEDKLQKQVSFLKDHGEYIGCSHPCVVVDRDGVPTSQEKLYWECDKKVITVDDFKGIFMPGQTATIVRRNIYKTRSDIDFSFFYRANESIGDRTTGLIYYTLGDFYRMDEAMSAYRITTDGNSITNQKYTRNKTWVKNDYEYTRKLMHFAWHELHSSADFSFHLWALLYHAREDFLEEPSVRGFVLGVRIAMSYIAAKIRSMNKHFI